MSVPPVDVCFRTCILAGDAHAPCTESTLQAPATTRPILTQYCCSYCKMGVHHEAQSTWRKRYSLRAKDILPITALQEAAHAATAPLCPRARGMVQSTQLRGLHPCPTQPSPPDICHQSTVTRTQHIPPERCYIHTMYWLSSSCARHRTDSSCTPSTYTAMIAHTQHRHENVHVQRAPALPRVHTSPTLHTNMLVQCKKHNLGLCATFEST